MSNFTFYDVKTRKKVDKSEDSIKKTIYKRKLASGAVQLRYALRAEHEDRWLTKFCTKTDWDALKVEEVAA